MVRTSVKFESFQNSSHFPLAFLVLTFSICIAIAHVQVEAVLRFRSVVVITCALHAQGPQFNPERKQS